jgi:hypothetical protein
VQEIERAINALSPPDLSKLYAWLDQHRPAQAISVGFEAAVFEHGFSPSPALRFTKLFLALKSCLM